MRAIVVTFPILNPNPDGIPIVGWFTFRYHDDKGIIFDQKTHQGFDDAWLCHRWCVERAKHRIFVND